MIAPAKLSRPLSPLPLLALALAATSFPTQALDWPHWRGPDYNGISQETGWAETWAPDGPPILWKAKVGIGFASFAVADNRVYTTGNAGKKENTDTVFCFDATSGNVIWKHTFEEDLGAKYYEGGTSATPTVRDGRVYTLSKTGLLLCLDAANGKVLMEKAVPQAVKQAVGDEAKKPTWGFAGSVLAQGDRLYVNVGTFGSALDKNGSLIWTTGAEASGYSTFVPFTMTGQSGLAVFAAKYVAGVDPASGKVLWRYPWKTNYDVNAADPIFHEDYVFISSGYNHGATLLRINGSQASKVWESKAMRNQMNSCVLIDGHLYGVDENQLRCLNFMTGDTLWTERSFGKGSLMAADGKLIALSEKGELLIAPAKPSGFEPTARAQILGGKCWTTPILANGRIYARNAKGDVVCIDVRK